MRGGEGGGGKLPSQTLEEEKVREKADISEREKVENN